MTMVMVAAAAGAAVPATELAASGGRVSKRTGDATAGDAPMAMPAPIPVSLAATR